MKRLHPRRDIGRYGAGTFTQAGSCSELELLVTLVWLEPSASMTYISWFPSRLERKAILVLSGVGVGVGVCVGTKASDM